MHVELAVGGGGKPVFARSAKGEYCGSNNLNVMGRFVMAKAGAAEAGKALDACEAFCGKSDGCTACR